MLGHGVGSTELEESGDSHSSDSSLFGYQNMRAGPDVVKPLLMLGCSQCGIRPDIIHVTITSTTSGSAG